MRRVIATAVAVAQLVGCTHIRPADPSAAHCPFDDINRALSGRTVQVRLMDGSTFSAENVRVTPSSTTLTVLSHARRDTVLDSSTIRTLSTTRRGAGAIRGLLGGLLVGATLGAIWGGASFDEPSILLQTETQAAIGGGLLLGSVVGVAGLIGGTIVGVTEVYDFTVTSPDRSTEQRR